jgi:hypothetical protein
MIRRANSRWRAICRARGRASQRVQAVARATRPVDADTLRRRALDDARGKVVREGCTYRAAGLTQWQVRRALGGRTDQFELVVNGRVRLRAGRRRFPKQFRPE